MYKSNSSSTKWLVTLAELLASTCVVYFVAFTFGASLIEDFLGNLAFSLLISLLCFLPSFVLIKHESPIELLDRLFIRNEFETGLERDLVNVSLATICGAWLGALVIPLDWDRWWQQWPISCVFGSIGAAILAVFYAIIVRGNFFKKKSHL
jgi:phosphatidylinositol glycan class F